MCPARPSLHWVPAVPGSPPSAVLWLAPIAQHPSRVTSYSFARRYHGASLINGGRGATRPCPREVLPVRDPAQFRGDVELSQVPGESLCACPAQATPARCAPSGHCNGRMRPSGVSTPSALAGKPVLGAQSHGLHTCCLRFAAWVAPMPRKTRFRLVTSLYPDGCCPRGTPVEVSDCHHSLPPGFPGAPKL